MIDLKHWLCYNSTVRFNGRIIFLGESMMTEKILNLISQKKFLYIGGNGGSGKTTFAQKLKNDLESKGKVVNVISVDDFMTNTAVRNSAVCKWEIDGKEFEGRCTSCCKEAYFWSAVDAIFHSLKNGLDVFYKPKREDMRKLFANADLTIVEGIASAFLDFEENSTSLWLECDKDTEIERRIKRGGGTHAQVEERNKVRDSQFVANVLPLKEKFDFVIDTSKE